MTRADRAEAQRLLDQFFFLLAFKWSGGRVEVLSRALELRERCEAMLDSMTEDA